MLDSIHLAVAVPGFGKPVCIKKYRLPWLDTDSARGELLIAKGTKRQPGRVKREDFIPPDQQRREMAGVADFDLARWACSPADEGGIMSRQRAFAKDPAGSLDELPERHEPLEAAVEAVHVKRYVCQRNTPEKVPALYY